MISFETKSRLLHEYSQKHVLVKKYQPFTFLLVLCFSFVNSIQEIGSISFMMNLLIGVLFAYSIISSNKYYIIFFILILFSTFVGFTISRDIHYCCLYNTVFLVIIILHYKFYSFINNWKLNHFLSYEVALNLLENENVNRKKADKINADLGVGEKSTSFLFSLVFQNMVHAIIPGLSFIIQPFLRESIFKQVSYEEAKVDIYTREKIKKIKLLMRALVLSTIGFLIISFLFIGFRDVLVHHKSWIYTLKIFISNQ